MIVKTPHIVANTDDIGKTVIMPGDPKRSKYIADDFLTNTKLINDVRGVQGYSGEYKGKKVFVMAHGMGMPSMHIYSYELYNFFNVENIIRIGSCGAISHNLDLNDIILVESAVTFSNIARNYEGINKKRQNSSKDLQKYIKQNAKKMKLNLKQGKVLCSDLFYDNSNCDAGDVLAVEMESFALFLNANTLNKKAVCLLTVSDLIFDKSKQLTSLERETSLNDMIKLALESAINF